MSRKSHTLSWVLFTTKESHRQSRIPEHLTGATYGAGSNYPSGAPEITSIFCDANVAEAFI